MRGRPSGVSSIWTRELRRRSPEPVKPAPCMKVAKPMPRLMVRGGVGAVELGALGVVAGLVEGAGEEVLHVDGVGEELAGGGAVAGGEEVAAAEFFGGEADDVGDLVHVALECRRWICGAPKPRKAPWGGRLVAMALARTAECGPVVGAGGVDGAAREDDGRRG